MALMAGSFFGRPAAAPFRSTTCSRRAPSLSHCSAMAAGSSEKTVTLSIAPCLKRTHLPSLRSIAGMINMDSRRRFPFQEVRKQLQSRGLAFLGVELHGKHVVARHRAGERQAVGAFTRRQSAYAGFGKITVH